jgi:hypothetical protein
MTFTSQPAPQTFETTDQGLGPAGRSRRAAILAAIQQQIADRRATLDRAEDLHSVEIVVRLHAGTTTIKSVVYSEERVHRSRRRVEAQ